MDTAVLHIELFGGLRVRQNGAAPIEFAGQQSGALLAYLALRLKLSHPREEMLDLLWRDDDIEDARPKLRQIVYSLRQQLEQPPFESGSLLLTSRTSLQLNPDRVVTDVALFEAAALRASQTADPRERIRHLSEACSLYRGDLLPGFYLDYFLIERNRLAEAHRGALHALTRALEEVGDRAGALECAQRAVSLNPLMEEAHCDLMRLYAETGRPSAALRQYQRLEHLLEEELGEKPSEVTRATMEAIRRAAPAVAVTPSAPAPTPSAAPAEREAAPTVTQAPPAAPRRLPWRRLAGAGALLVVALASVVVWRVRAHRPPATPPSRPNAAPADDGTPLWLARYTPRPDEQDSEPTAIACDLVNNIYVAGFVHTTEAAHRDVDFLTLKYDPDGHELWRATYDGPSHDVDRARCILVDEAGNVYVAGESDNGKGNNTTRLAGTDFAVIRYEAATGRRSSAWPDIGFGVGVRRYNGPDDGEDRPVQLAGDLAGNVYVLGKSWGRGKSGKGGFDYALVKYDARGDRKWVMRYDGGHGDDVPTCMALLARDGFVWVTGYSRSEPASGPEYDWLTLKVRTADGRIVWERRYGEGNRADDYARSISVDDGGNVCVAGDARGAPGTPDALRVSAMSIRYDPTGRIEWKRGTTRESDRIEQMGAKMLGTGPPLTVVTGLGASAAGGPVWRTVVRDASGFPRWSSDCPGQSWPPHGVIGLLTGVYIFGTVPSEHGLTDLNMVKYDWAGNLIWSRRYDGANGPEQAAALSSDPAGHPIATGQSGDGKLRDIVVIKYPP